jgi:hypothetical protein
MYCLTQTLHTAFENDPSNRDLKAAHWLSNIGTIVRTLRDTQLQQQAVNYGNRFTHQTAQPDIWTHPADMTKAYFGPYGVYPSADSTSCTTCVKDAAAIINEDFPDAVDRLFSSMKTMCVVASDLSSALLCYCKTLFH